jgi:predicted amidohydrolase YtcJ
MSEGQERTQADMIFVGGDIITVDDTNPTAEALAVGGENILAVGARDDVLKFKGSQTEMVDLEGKTLMPGLIEPHSHPIISALLYEWTDVSGFNNANGAEVMERLHKAAADAKPGEWIGAFGYDPILIRDLKSLSADMLDEISSTNPIFIMIQSMHTVYVNHKAFEVVGITNDTPQPERGTYVKDEDGNLTGMVIEQEAITPLLMSMLGNVQGRSTELINKQLWRYAKAGYTSVGAMGVFPVFLDWMSVLKELIEGDDCPIRMSVMNKATDLELGFEIDFGPDTDRLCSGGAKFWYDGSYGTGNVLLDEPFVNSELLQKGLGVPEDTCGSSMMPKERLRELIQKYHDAGMQISVHGQGDRGIRDIIDAYEAVLETSPREDHRHRIEHGGLFPLDDMERAARLGITPSWHINYVYYYGEAMRDEIVGPERAERCYPIGAANRAGHRSSVHNDSPMYPAEPFRLMRTAVTRKSRKDETIGADQAITVEDAIKAVTIYPAWQMFMEDKVGSLEAGKLADLVIVSENPLTVEPDRLDQVRVIATYRSGHRFSHEA